MQIKKLLPPLMVVLTLVLAACGPTIGATGTSVGGTLPAETTTAGASESTLPAMTETTGTAPAMTETVGTPASGETGTPSGTEVLPPTGSTDPGRVSNILQFGVYNQNNEQIGNVQDLVVDFNLASISYVVVNSASGSLIPVPWDALTLVTSDSGTQSGSPNTFVLKVHQSVFDGAPTIDLSAFPQFGNEAGNWDADIRSYWESNMGMGTETATPGTTQMSTEMPTMPATTAEPTMPATIEQPSTGLIGVALATQLIGQSLQIPGANLTLAVNDIIIDVVSGNVQYLVISLTVGSGSASLVPVPLKDFGLNTSTSNLSLNLSADQLQAAPSFSPDAFPNTQQSGWDSNYSSYWSSLPTS